MIEDRIRSRLRVLQAERDVIDRAIAELATLLSLEGVPEDAPEPPAKPKPAPGKPAAPGRRGRPCGPKRDWPRLLLAALKNGPKSFATLEREFRSRTATFGPTLRGNPWFERTDPVNMFSPWRLTEAGKSAAAAASPP